MKRLISLVLTLILVLCASAGLMSIDVKTSALSVKKVKLNKTKINLNVGDKYALKLKNASSKVKWSVSDKRVATVSAKGKVTAKRPGIAYVWAYFRGGYYECAVYVRTWLIGHRGYSSMYPENTIPAFTGAVENGFDGIECDLWEGDEGLLLIHHDQTLKRMLKTDGYIWNMTAEEILEYPVKGGANIAKFTDPLYVPTLEETLKAIKGTKTRFMLHIKGNEDYELSEEGEEKVIKLLNKYKMKSRTTLIGSYNYIKPFVGTGFDLAVISDVQDENHLYKAVKWCKKNKVKTLLCLNFESLFVLGTKTAFRDYMLNQKMFFGLYSTLKNSEYKTLGRMGAVYAVSDFKLKWST